MAKVKINEPQFSGKARLVRYVRESDRLAGNRAAIPAFLPDPPSPDGSMKDDHLSVNSLEVETLRQMADYHRLNSQNNTGDVALVDHQVNDYNDAGKKSDAAINFDKSSQKWIFNELTGKTAAAYKHRPVTPNKKNSLGSISHCGVEFIRVFNEYKAGQFARRLAGRGKFHIVKA